MNRAVPEMLIQNQIQQQQQQSYFNGTELGCLIGEAAATRSVKPDPGSVKGWSELGRIEIPSSGFGSCGFDLHLNSAISRTASCPPAAKMCSAVGRESFKKRKGQNDTKVSDDETKDKKIKVSSGETKIATEQNINKNCNNRETSGDASKDDSKASEVQNQKTDYIHVRARRGQATDSHSLAERVRREKISERMKYLQDLVPGCNKITGKAGMLDEIINYVQSLQQQVEFLSMKLATLNPQMDCNTDNVFAKEMFPSTAANFPIPIGMSPEMANPAYMQFNPTQQVISGCGLEMSSSEMALRRTISAPVSFPEPFMDSSCFTASSDWNGDLQNLYNV